MSAPRPWTPADDEAVRKYAAGELTAAECGTLLDRTSEAVRKRASRIAIRRLPRVDMWTAEADARLREMRDAGLPWTAIAEALGRSVDAVKSRAKRKGTAEPAKRAPLADGDLVPETPIDTAVLATLPERRPWTQAEDDWLAGTYGSTAPYPRDDAAIAATLHRPVESIKRRATIIGLAPLYPPHPPSPPRPERHHWTPEEDATLRRAWPDGDVSAIADALGLVAMDVRRRAGQLGLMAPARPHPAPGS